MNPQDATIEIILAMLKNREVSILKKIVKLCQIIH